MSPAYLYKDGKVAGGAHETASDTDADADDSNSDAKAALDIAQTTTEFNQVIRAVALSRPKHGHVAFVTHALERIERTGAKPDVATMDGLIAVFPEENAFMTNALMDAIWPKDTLQSETALNLLTTMEEHFVIPESSTNALLIR
eukprot:gene14922-1136_t